MKQVPIKPGIQFSMLELTVLLSFIFITDSFAQPHLAGSGSRLADFKQLPEVKWIYKTSAAIFSSPVVCENLVLFGGLDSMLHAIDIVSGKQLWTFRTNGEIRSNACIGADKIYLNGGDGSIYALKKNSGELIWKFSTEGEKRYDFADYFHSSPILFDRLLYFGSGDGNLYAVDALTGKLVWKFKSDNIIHATPVIANDMIFFGSFDGNMYCLNMSSGELIWKFKTVGHRYFPKGEVQGSASIFKNLIFFGARDYNVYALDENKGYCHWNKAFTRGWALCNNIHDSVLYIGSADERVLIAADPETGREFWKTSMEFLVFGNNAYSDSILYLGTTNGKLHAFSLSSGRKIWSFETDSYSKNKHKYFKSDDTYRDDIYTIIKSNEQFLDVECELGGIFSTPCIYNSFIIFSSTNGKLYCLKR